MYIAISKRMKRANILPDSYAVQDTRMRRGSHTHGAYDLAGITVPIKLTCESWSVSVYLCASW